MSGRAINFIFLFFFAVPAFSATGESRILLYSLNGDLHRSSEIIDRIGENEKIVYSFWSFSCLPCMVEFPRLLQMQKEKPSAKFYFVNVLDEKEKINQYAEKNNIDKSAILLDERLTGAKNFKVLNASKQPILPQLFVVDKAGKIVFKMSGFTEDNMRRLQSFLGA